MTKRRRFILQSIILCLILFAIQMVDVGLRYWMILATSILAYFLTAFSLREEVRKISWIIVLPIPAFYTASVGLFYFLLPESIVTRIITISLFGIGMYSLLLTQNIYSVAAIRTIQLLRAAQAVGFIITLVTIFFIYGTIFSFNLSSWWNALLVFIFSFLLILSAIWSVTLDEKVNKKQIIYSLCLCFLAAVLSFFISFWPLSITAISLFLVSFWYVSLGICQNLLVGKLFQKTAIEYIRVAIIIFIITFFLAKWSG